MKYSENVKAGAAFLDEVALTWRENIDIAELDLAHDYKCTLAQALQMKYSHALAQLDLSHEDAKKYGFMLDTSTTTLEEDSANFAELTEDWKAWFQETAIDQGIELFNRAVPGWRNSINLSTLDMSSEHGCVVAQVTGMSYHSGLSVLGVRLDRADNYGFSIQWNPKTSIAEDEEKYAELTIAWKEKLSASTSSV